MNRRKLSEIPDCPPGTEGYISPTPRADRIVQDEKAKQENMLKEVYSFLITL